MSKVNRDAWKPGALWITENEKGYSLEAIVIKADKPGHKIIRMTYMDGPWKDRPVEQSYSHRHMLKYFTFTGMFREVPQPLSPEETL